MSKLIKSNYVREIIRTSKLKSLDCTDEDNDNLAEISCLQNQVELLKEELRNKEYAANEKAENCMKEAEIEIEKIIAKAYADRDELLDQTYIKVKEISEENKQKGYEEGYQFGYEEGKTTSNELIDEANDYKKEYWKMREGAIKDAEIDFVKMLEMIVKKIFNKQMEDETIILSIVKNGIENIGNCTSIVILVSEEDFDILEISKSRILAMFPLIENMEVKTDYSLKHGDCIIEGDRGSIDVSVQMQLDQIEELIQNLVQNE